MMGFTWLALLIVFFNMVTSWAFTPNVLTNLAVWHADDLMEIYKSRIDVCGFFTKVSAFFSVRAADNSTEQKDFEPSLEGLSLLDYNL